MGGGPIRGVRAVLFDLDGTLAQYGDAMSSAHSAVAYAARRHLSGGGFWVDEGWLRTEVGRVAGDMARQGRYDRGEWWLELWRRAGIMDREPGDELVARLTGAYWSAWRSRQALYADAEGTLARLKGRRYKLGMVVDTDGILGLKRRRISELGLAKSFRVVVVAGEDTPRVKPDPEPFMLAAQRLGLPPGRCAVVGDTPFADVKGARAAGMRPILVRRRDWDNDGGPDRTVRRLSELLNLLPR